MKKMVEGQPLYSDTPETFAALKATLSEQRLGTYLARAGGDENYAFALYLYNARLAGAFLFPLSVAEVTLRNAVDFALVQTHGENWLANRSFVDRILTPESRRSLDRASDRVGGTDRDKLIAGLSFDFWSNLFRPEYGDLWQMSIRVAFPNLPHGEGREKIQNLVRDINRIRNRVAHHEHLLDLNVRDVLSKTLELTGLRCPVTSDWMRRNSTVNRVMQGKPKASGHAPVTLKDRSGSDFLVVSATDSIARLCSAMAGSCSAFVCVGPTGVEGAFTKAQLADFIASRAGDANGLIDLGDHRVSEVLETEDVRRGCRVLDSETNFFDAVEELKETRARIVVALDGEAHAPVGVVLRAHRRY